MIKQTQIALATAATFAAASASAALPTGVDTAITALQADAIAAVELVIPAVIAVTSIFIMVKLIKKVLGKVG